MGARRAEAVAHRRSHTNLVVHVVWSTRHRVGVLREDGDLWLAELLIRKAERLGCSLLDVGVAPDHVHVLAVLAPAASLPTLVRRMKGASSRAWDLEHPGGSLPWQDGYWAESCSPGSLEPLVSYIIDQRGRHAREVAAESWETLSDS
jgi:REP element-mobilizing transposase RayT